MHNISMQLRNYALTTLMLEEIDTERKGREIFDLMVDNDNTEVVEENMEGEGFEKKKSVMGKILPVFQFKKEG